MGKSTISMVIFNSYFDITGGYPYEIPSPSAHRIACTSCRLHFFSSAARSRAPTLRATMRRSARCWQVPPAATPRRTGDLFGKFLGFSWSFNPWRIHGAGIYANIKGVYWWDPWHTIYSSTMDPSWVMEACSLGDSGDLIPWRRFLKHLGYLWISHYPNRNHSRDIRAILWYPILKPPVGPPCHPILCWIKHGATSAICAAMRAMLFRPTPLTPTNKALPHAAIEDH